MTVESATYVGQLNVSLPPGSDQISEGDNHLRLIKQVLQNTFPSVTSNIFARANTWTSAQTITVPSATTALTLVSTEDGAGAAPGMSLYRDSASPAASDVLGIFNWVGRDTATPASNVITYAQMYAVLENPAPTLKASQIRFATWQDNVFTTTMQLFGATLRVTSGDDLAGAEPVLDLFRDSASPADNDAIGYISFSGRAVAAPAVPPDPNPYTVYAQLYTVITDADVATGPNAELRFGLVNGATSPSLFLRMNATAIFPAIAGNVSLGLPTLPFGVVYLDGDAFLDWENGLARITYAQASDTLFISGSKMSMTGATTISGAATLSSTLSVTGIASFANRLIVNETVASVMINTTDDAVVLQLESGNQNANTAQVLSIIIGGSAGSNERYVRFGDDINGLQGTIHSRGVGQGVVYGEGSDERLKTNIRDLDDSGAIMDALRPRRFSWKTGGAESFGFIAQEVHEIVPSVVSVGGDDPVEQPWQMQRGSMEAILVAEIKSLRARVAALEAA